jgi:hypothetical protein
MKKLRCMHREEKLYNKSDKHRNYEASFGITCHHYVIKFIPCDSVLPYFLDHRPLLFFSDKLAAADTPNAAYLLFYEVYEPKITFD